MSCASCRSNSTIETCRQTRRGAHEVGLPDMRRLLRQALLDQPIGTIRAAFGGRWKLSPTTSVAAALVAVAIAALVVAVTTAVFDNWAPNIATEALSIAVTVFVVERIVRREAERQLQPRRERALSVLANAFIKFSRMAHFDYAGTHLASDLSEIPEDPVEMLRVWQENYDAKDAPHVPAGSRPLLLEEAVAFVEKAQRIVDTERNQLPSDLVVAVENLGHSFGGHGQPFLDMVRDQSVRRPPDGWLCLVAVASARPVGEALKRHRVLPPYPSPE
jgi:hypothetical protein